ncbi:MAG TPA: alpha-L-arabinofuranosidase C-terminal domain-containing protein [Acidobacteriaceae bacterium]|nr:alpha-L-arabinofuranosidase C-terminal domain-containing protein [Acidobacteriaceae bacterium]
MKTLSFSIIILFGGRISFPPGFRMTFKLRCLALLVLTFFLLSFSAQIASAQITIDQPIPPVATVHVDASRDAGAEISRTIFGSFLEPIGNSTYNGLWAQILQNPSLEAGLWDAPHVRMMLHEHPELARASELGLPLPWEPLDFAQGNRYQIDYGHAANSWRSLVIIGLPDQPTGIRQEVYLPVQRELSYVGSLYARHISGPTGLTVSIRDHDSARVLASAHIDATQPDWTKYTFTLNVPQGALHRLDPADFVVQVEGDEQVGLDEFSLMPADNLDGLDPDVVAMAKAMDTTLVRFGGNFTSTYNWRNGIGPRDKRISMMNLAWGIPEYNTFGTDEFLHFCSLIGAEPQFALNLGDGTPQEAADWVQYIDQHWHKHSGLLWELGNELWGNWNLGYPTLNQLAARTLAFSKAVQAVDPTARLIATGEDPDNFTQWNAVQLGNPAGTFNDLSTHFVVTVSDTQLPHPSTDFTDSAAFALPTELGRKLQAQQDQINQYPAFSGKAHIAFTEWLFIGHRPGTPNFTNMGGAIDTAGFFNMLMRHTSIVPISDMTGIMDFAGIWKDRSQVYGAPGYYAFRMYASAHPSQPVAVTTDSGSYSVQHGVTRLPDIANVPYLDVVAALNQSGSKLTLFCVNRSLNTDIPANIDIAHFPATEHADIQTLRSNSISDVNDADNPDRVIPVHTVQSLHSGTLHHVFPHESVTVITLHKAS